MFFYSHLRPIVVLFYFFVPLLFFIFFFTVHKPCTQIANPKIRTYDFFFLSIKASNTTYTIACIFQMAALKANSVTDL
ncbi:hypothetical protein BDB00DRAFT_857603 [Zychaea mexicana]|uniref:uncharacterized protein n=1 Tax=Zychaea mexicana TaxID=64656 RepID=UPI0022FF436A|nr:uncharacterized protein BDB00DRAFT_857603 [Zychaea mexicana]KAI9482501.1 hypothetical protein BDB00DRAFT_857603 [Zychaea mexicana]